MHLRITAVSFFCRFPYETLEIQERPTDKMAIVEVCVRSLVQLVMQRVADLLEAPKCFICRLSKRFPELI